MQVNSPTAVVNGETVELDVAPYIDPGSGRTLVPIRFISESLGYIVLWNAESKNVYIHNKIELGTRRSTTKDSVEYLWSWAIYKFVSLEIASDVAQTCNHYAIGEYNYMEEETLDQPPVIKDGRTMIPIRFVAEQMDLNVDWDNKTKKITISSKGDEYVPLPIETGLDKIAVAYDYSDEKIEDYSIYMKSEEPENYLLKISTDEFRYYINLAVKSGESYQPVLSGRLIGFEEDLASFHYLYNDEEGTTNYKYYGTLQIKDGLLL